MTNEECISTFQKESGLICKNPKEELSPSAFAPSPLSDVPNHLSDVEGTCNVSYTSVRGLYATHACGFKLLVYEALSYVTSV